MEIKLSNNILSIQDGFIKSDEIINKISPGAFLSNVLLTFNKNLSVEGIKFLYYEKLSNQTGYQSYIVDIDNINLKASFSGEGYFPQEKIDELSSFDPASYPPNKLDLKKVNIDTEQLVKIALNEPPHFIPSASNYLSNIEASLFMQNESILWRFLCENIKAGMRTLHIDAETGTIVLYKLDKLTREND